MSQSPVLPVSKSRAAGAEPAAFATSLFRWSPRDARLAAAAVLQVGLLAALVPFVLAAGLPGALAFAAWFALTIVWGSNTIAHVHIHTPLFRAKLHNEAFCVLLSLWLGVPQTIWRRRHLAHHAGQASREKGSALRGRGALEIALIGLLWAALLAALPRFFLFAYAPGYALGMALAWVVGHYEHRDEEATLEGVSHYGRLHNLLWVNDGYHVEHHRFPNEHWTRLPGRRAPGTAESAHPPLFRWLDPPRDGGRSSGRAPAILLGALERVVLRSALLQRLVISCHERAFRALFSKLDIAHLQRVCVVGGGLFPRTVIALRRILPEAHIVVLDGSKENLEQAREHLAGLGLERDVELLLGRFEPAMTIETDLLIAPLAFEGDREALYATPRPAVTVVHDWLWRRRGSASAIVSLFLLKRVNVVLPRSLS